MSYKALLAYVDTSSESEVRLQAALGLARKLGAMVIGLAAGLPRQIADPYTGVMTALALETEREQIEADLKSAKAKFDALATKASVKSEWRAMYGYPAVEMAAAAAAADLVVVGQAEAGLIHDAYTSVAPGDILMGSGRPVLVIPPNVATIDLREIVVAWKDTREARRAVSDALPLLKVAENVVILEIRSGRGAGGADDSLADVEAFLKRHGVPVVGQSVVLQDASIQEQLFRFATSAGSGLIVAGGYGHTRLREWMFGGVTRALLTESPIPALVSH